MSNLIKYSFIVMAAFIFMACNESEKERQVTPYCFVYCDFTGSMDSAGHEKVIRNALTIYDSLKQSHFIRFYIVSQNSAREAFFKSEPQEGSNKTEVEEYYAELAKPKLRDSLRQLLIQQWKTEKSKGTCIIEAIKQAINEFHGVDTNLLASRRFIFLSDMRESCDAIDIENGQYDSALAVLDRMQVDDSFTVFNQLDVAIVLSTTNAKDNKGGKIDMDKHNRFWKAVFQKFGYAASRIRLSCDIPAWAIR